MNFEKKSKKIEETFEKKSEILGQGGQGKK